MVKAAAVSRRRLTPPPTAALGGNAEYRWDTGHTKHDLLPKCRPLVWRSFLTRTLASVVVPMKRPPFLRRTAALRRAWYASVSVVHE